MFSCFPVLGAFAKLREAATSFMFIIPSAWNNSATDGGYFHEILYLGILRKSVEKIQVSSKSDKDRGYNT